MYVKKTMHDVTYDVTKAENETGRLVPSKPLFVFL